MPIKLASGSGRVRRGENVKRGISIMVFRQKAIGWERGSKTFTVEEGLYDLDEASFILKGLLTITETQSTIVKLRKMYRQIKNSEN